MKSHRVIRGGSYFNDTQNCRTAYRNHNAPDNANDNIGLRLALSPSSQDSRMAPLNRQKSSPKGFLG